MTFSRSDGSQGRRTLPYIIDLGSGNGTFLNNERIEPQRYYELKVKFFFKIIFILFFLGSRYFKIWF